MMVFSDPGLATMNIAWMQRLLGCLCTWALRPVTRSQVVALERYRAGKACLD